MIVNTIRRASPVDLALLIAIAVIWASAFIAIKIAVPETGPFWLAAFRVGIGAAILTPYALMTRSVRKPDSTRQWGLIVTMSALNVVIPFVLISWAELTIDAGVTALLMGTGPFMALVGSHFFTADDRITGPKLAAVLLGFAGVITLVGGDALSDLGGGHTLAQLAALGGSICYVVAGLLIRHIRVSPLALAVLALTIGTAILVPMALIVEGPPPLTISAGSWLALVYLGAIPTGLAYILRFHLINTVGYTTFALSVNMIPVFGVLLGVILLGETLNPRVLVALLLIVSGLLVNRMSGFAGRAGQNP